MFYIKKYIFSENILIYNEKVKKNCTKCIICGIIFKYRTYLDSDMGIKINSNTDDE